MKMDKKAKHLAGLIKAEKKMFKFNFSFSRKGLERITYSHLLRLLPEKKKKI